MCSEQTAAANQATQVIKIVEALPVAIDAEYFGADHFVPLNTKRMASRTPTASQLDQETLRWCSRGLAEKLVWDFEAGGWIEIERTVAM
jgi:hypothetical protein